MSKWQTSQPPNEVLVEVEEGKKIIRVMAFYGRDGTRPHWRTKNGSRAWPVSAFSRWREIEMKPKEEKVNSRKPLRRLILD